MKNFSIDTKNTKLVQQTFFHFPIWTFFLPLHTFFTTFFLSKIFIHNFHKFFVLFPQPNLHFTIVFKFSSETSCLIKFSQTFYQLIAQNRARKILMSRFIVFKDVSDLLECRNGNFVEKFFLSHSYTRGYVNFFICVVVFSIFIHKKLWMS